MENIISFIEENVNGKTLFTKELVYKLENGALEGVYSDQISFSNLKYSQSVSLFRFELAKRKSAEAITGSFRLISASGKNTAAEAIISGIYGVCLENNVLKFYEDQALYRDQPIQNEKYKAVAFQSQHSFYCQNGKLHYEYDGKCFDVDTKTMQRANSSDKFPKFISIEK